MITNKDIIEHTEFLLYSRILIAFLINKMKNKTKKLMDNFAQSVKTKFIETDFM